MIQIYKILETDDYLLSCTKANSNPIYNGVYVEVPRYVYATVSKGGDGKYTYEVSEALSLPVFTTGVEFVRKEDTPLGVYDKIIEFQESLIEDRGKLPIIWKANEKGWISDSESIVLDKAGKTMFNDFDILY